MKKLLGLVLFLCMIIAFPSAGIAKDDDLEWNKILFAAESLFKAMKERNYPAIWGLLSAESKNNIVKNVERASIKSGVVYSKEQIKIDFAIGGLISRTYWNSYLNEFDPDMVLEHSKWEMGTVKKDSAVIKIQYKNSRQPALFKMYKENGTWTVGLEETFEGRKYLIFF